MDVAPTLLSLAGIVPPKIMDGESMAKLLLSPLGSSKDTLEPAQRSVVSEALSAAAGAPDAAGWRDQFLVEYMSVATRTASEDPNSACVSYNLTNEHTCACPLLCVARAHRRACMSRRRFDFGSHHRPAALHRNIWYPSSPADWKGTNARCPAKPANDSTAEWLIDDGLSNSFRGLRVINQTVDLSYFEFVDCHWDWDGERKPVFYELFDLKADPHQLHNLYGTWTGAVPAELHQRLVTAFGCGVKNGTATSDCV